ncbi:adenine glycosylase [Thermophilibacter mediterraneus]|uniref:adenine glycosylase n=1 Tax=Thermophilibacter mediterraneus TaxID=1871031 RepID=UPI0032092117
MSGLADGALGEFRARVLERGRELYRDLPWRRTRDPYAVWVSEVMLQQTQTTRVDGRWQRWLERFPTVEALAAADAADVLDEWQGLGYNRRALSLARAAAAVCERGGAVPSDAAELEALPGIGPATAAGIRAFAFDLPGVYLETNVRAVLLHELYPGAEGVPDRELVPVVRATCPPDASDPSDDPRTWYYALLDYGAYLKRTVPNPSRRSSGHVRQSRFEGSHRQKRAEALRVLLAHRGEGAAGATFEEFFEALAQEEARAGRSALGAPDALALLEELAAEGFCRHENGVWRI